MPARENMTRPNTQLTADVVSAIEHLDAWIAKNGWAGYDPYDIKGKRIYMWALGLPREPFIRNVVRKLALGPLLIGEMIFPSAARALFRVKPAVNPKGMALLAKAYLNLFRTTAKTEYRSKALACLDWLLHNTSPGVSYPCWGYPFDWRTGVIVPAFTPTSVVSAAACDAFWTAWQVTSERRYLDICVNICNGFIDGLNIDRIDADTICFSYTPLDDFHVHNVNLLVAELLVRVGTATERHDWVHLGEKAAHYALREQNEDGSIFYWGRVQQHTKPGRVDHYHSGFEMRSLYGIWKITGKCKYKKALDRYYAFYLSNLIEREFEAAIPKMYPHSKYPINIHSCAEGLLLNATLTPDYSQARALMEQMLHWIILKMQKRDGHFIYMRRRFFGLEWQSTIAYWRWGQAWMMLALSGVLLALANDDIPESGTNPTPST